MALDVFGAGACHDHSGPGPLLRRDGARQERVEHHDVQFHLGVRGQRGLGVLWGYTIAFGTDVGGIVGSFEFLGSDGVGPEAFPGTAVPHLAFMVFQLMFAGITVALISGAIAERMKFVAFVLFAVLWVTLIYAPLAHWVWGGGWLGELGALDFAGGTVVHISSGVAALAAALILGETARLWGRENGSP